MLLSKFESAGEFVLYNMDQLVDTLDVWLERFQVGWYQK